MIITRRLLKTRFDKTKIWNVEFDRYLREISFSSPRRLATKGLQIPSLKNSWSCAVLIDLSIKKITSDLTPSIFGNPYDFSRTAPFPEIRFRSPEIILQYLTRSRQKKEVRHYTLASAYAE